LPARTAGLQAATVSYFPDDTAAVIGDGTPWGIAVDAGMARPDIETQRDGQNRGRKCQFEREDFHAGSLGSRVRKAMCRTRSRKSGKKKNRRKKSKQEKTWKRRAFCARLLFPLGFPPWQCSCFVLEYTMCLAIGPKVA
jgi:hypothetical protein